MLSLPAANAAEKKKGEEEFKQSFVYTGSNLSSHAGGKAHTEAAEHAQQFSAEEVARRQEDVRQFLAGKTGELTPKDVAELYRRAKHYSIIHGMLASGEIDAATSRRIGQGRQGLVETVLARLAAQLKAKTMRLGVNDFGSGEVNAKTDMDMTLFPESESIKSEWLTSQFKSLFKSEAGIDPAQMDVTVHRHDATIPDWRQQRSVADFELRMRTGRELLKRNPEAYFLEGAYVQEVMGRSVKEGGKTFRWYEVEGDKVTTKRLNAAEVPQFFYHPNTRSRYAWGAAVGNWHFWNSHAGDLASEAKYLLRSLDEGAALALADDPGFRALKTKDYAELPDAQRRQVVERIYGDTKLPAGLREKIFLVLEAARQVRQLKKAGQPTTDEAVLSGLMRHHEAQAGFAKVSREALLERAKDTYKKVSQLILAENIMKAAAPRLNDWLAPRPEDLRTRTVKFVDEDGNLRDLPYTQDMQTRLQYAAFFELMDSVELMRPEMLSRLKRENARFAHDIKIIEDIVRKRREMMLAPEDPAGPPKDPVEFRQRAAQDVLDAYEELSKSRNTQGLFRFKTLSKAWAFGSAFEDWSKSRLGDALVHTMGDKYGTLLDSLRLTTKGVEAELISPTWTARIGYANSLVNVLTEYVRQGEFNLEVGKALAREGLTYVPVVGTVLDIRDAPGMAVLQIVYTQFIPGYGQVMLVLNTAKGVVTLGGEAIFQPLKRDSILLAYQGYLDPTPAGLLSTGFKTRQESRRTRALLDPIAPAELPLEQRRAKVYGYFQPQVLPIVARRVENDWNPADAEADVMRIAATRYVRDWWSGVGAFQSYDELAIDSGIEVKFQQEIEAELVRLLMQDYWTGKVLYEEERRKRLREMLEEVANVEIGLQSSGKGLGGDFEKAGQLTQGYTLAEMPQVQAGIEISAAPRVVMERDKSGREVPRIESYGLRAIINASPTETHPGPFRVSWELNPPGQGSSRMTRPGSESKLETAADRVEVAAVLVDAEGRMMERATLSLPMRKERVEEKQEEVRLDRPAPTQPDKAKVTSADCGPLRDQYFKRCKKMADEHIRKNCTPIYSGCAMDVAGCGNAYINDALPDDYCAQPGYIGCATGQLDAFLGCLQRCNDDLLARKINTYGITPCRLSCQEKVTAGIKACKAGRIPPPSSGSDQQVVSTQQPKTGPDGPSAPPPATEPPPAPDREAASMPAEREQVSGEFGASLDKRWKVVSPNQESSVRLTNNGALRMTAPARQGGSDFSPGPNNNAPRILQPVSGDWILETRIHFAPTAHFQGAGILVCFDARPESANGWRVIERQFHGGRQIVNFSGAQKDFTGSTTYLRVRKKGNNYTAWYSVDGRIWTEAGTRKELRVPTHAGVMTTRQPWDRNLNLDSVAVYDYVRIIRE